MFDGPSRSTISTLHLKHTQNLAKQREIKKVKHTLIDCIFFICKIEWKIKSKNKIEIAISVTLAYYCCAASKLIFTLYILNKTKKIFRFIIT